LGIAGAGGELGLLALAEQGPDLVGIEQAGQAEEVFLLRRAGRGRGAELAAVVEDPVEVNGRVERLEGGPVLDIAGVALALRLREFVLLGRLRTGAGSKHVVPFGLKLGGEPEQDRHRGQEHRGGLAPPARPDEPAHGLGEVQGGGHAGRVHADGQPRDVHSLRDHPDGDHPALVRGGERGDLF